MKATHLTWKNTKVHVVDWNAVISVLTSLVVAALITILAGRDFIRGKEGKKDEDKKVISLKPSDITESIKLNFETVKHLTTLTAGSFVLTATFLKDIFPKNPALTLKLPIAATFLCFSLALIFSAWGLWGLSIMPRTYDTINEKKKQQGKFVLIPAYFLVIGLACFGVAVLINLFNLGPVANVSLVILLAYSAGVLGYLIYSEYQKTVRRESDREYNVEQFPPIL